MVFINSNELPIGFFRPPVKKGFNPDKDDLTMHIVDWADGDGHNKIEGKRGKGERVYKIRMYGNTMDGNSVCVHVGGFQPYFYVKIPQNWGELEIEDFIEAVKDKVKSGTKHYYVDTLLSHELVKYQTLYWFDNGEKYNFIKFSFKHKSGFYAYKNVFDEPIFIRNIDKVHPFDFKRAMYQTNIEPKLLFMHAQDINACGWITLKAGTYSFRDNEFTRCQINVDVHWKQVIADNENNAISPMIIAAFDGEMKSEDGSFPVATNKKDPVIQLGTTVHRYGENKISLNYIVVLGDCDDFAPNDPNTWIECIPYDRDDPKDILRAERQLLITWAHFIERLDPDIVTGYNIWGFDMKYLFIRMNDYKDYDPEDAWNLKKGVKKFLSIIDRRNDWEVTGKLYIEKDLNSSGMGENKLYYFNSEGIVQFDLYKVIQTDVTKKLESYKLDFVSELYLGENKMPLTPKQMFLNFNDGHPSKIAEIAVYCVQDCALCNRLTMKLATDSNGIGMSNVCSVPFSYIFSRGLGVKLFSLVVKLCNQEGILCPVIDREMVDPSSYEGAIVFEPVPGIYTEPIEVLDYASLYPSSMIAENISHDTLVMVKTYDINGNLVSHQGDEQLMDMDGYCYNKITYDRYKKVKENDEDIPDELPIDLSTQNVFEFMLKGNKLVRKKGKKKKKKEKKSVKIGYKECYFIEKEDRMPENKGILPRIEMKLLKARRDTRKKIKYKTVTYDGIKKATGLLKEKGDIYEVTCDDGTVIKIPKDKITDIVDTYTKFEQVILDGLQQAYKVACNSLYGQLGATTSSICFKELAACTTAIGRKMLITAKDLIEERYPSTKIVYGDSVTGDTPVILKTEGTGVVILPIADVAEYFSGQWEEYPQFVKEGDDKRSASFDKKIEVWCGPVIENLNREAIQDKLRKVDVKDYQTGGWQPLRKVVKHKTQKSIYRVESNSGIVDVTEDHSLIGVNGELMKPEDINERRVLCGMPRDVCNNGELDSKRGWLLGFLLANLESDCRMLESKNKNILLKAKELLEESENVSRIGNIYRLSLTYSTKQYKDLLFYRNGEKWVHPVVLNADNSVKQAFFDGYFHKGSKIDFENKPRVMLQGLWFIMDCLGLEMKDNKVRKITELQRTESKIAVYDLETGSGRFQAGVGSMIVSNTDSVFVDFTPYIKNNGGEDYDTMELSREAMRLAFEAGKYVSSKLKHPQDLEREKQFRPFIIFSKKRYISMKYTKDLNKGKVDSMGIATKRRDNARQLVAEIYGGAVEVVLEELDIDKSKEYFREKVKKLLSGGFTLDELKVTKSVKASSSYKNPTSIAPRVLADRMCERDPGNKVMPSERLAYAFIEDSNLKCEVCNIKINVNRCKCVNCMHIFCKTHISNHRSQCLWRCRFCKERRCLTVVSNRMKANVRKMVDSMPLINLDPDGDIIKQVEEQLNCTFYCNKKLFKCNTCKAPYCLKDMYKHRCKEEKDTGVVTLDKCKKMVTQKLCQGDRIETLDYIRENNLKIDYKYYLDHQILNPSMQFFSLTMDKPEKLLQDILAEDSRKKKGMKSLASFGFLPS